MVLLYYNKLELLKTYQELLLEELEFEHVVLKTELSVCELDRLLSSARIILRVDSLDADDYWVVVISHSSKIIQSVLALRQNGYLWRERLLDTLRELVSSW